MSNNRSHFVIVIIQSLKLIMYVLIYLPYLDPFICPWEQVDRGAIRFVLSGANIMCPGLTSPGAKMTSVPKGTVVVSLASIFLKYYVKYFFVYFVYRVVFLSYLYFN